MGLSRDLAKLNVLNETERGGLMLSTLYAAPKAKNVQLNVQCV